jgi:very-short-patch-repair endonuclease
MSKEIHNTKYLKVARKDLRNNLTPQETILWKRLKNSNSGYKFRRQHSIKNFITDFYCPAKKLVIEIDGGQHIDNKEYDYERTKVFEDLGIKVLRFWNNEINNNIKGVLEKIKSELELPSSAEEGWPS